MRHQRLCFTYASFSLKENDRRKYPDAVKCLPESQLLEIKFWRELREAAGRYAKTHYKNLLHIVSVTKVGAFFKRDCRMLSDRRRTSRSLGTVGAKSTFR